MRWSEDDAVPQTQDVTNGGMQLSGIRCSGRLAGQVGATDVANEQGITGKSEEGIFSYGRIADGIRHALIGMPGSFHGANAQASDGAFVPVGDAGAERKRQRTTMDDLGAHAMLQFVRTEDEVFLPMGFQDVADTRSLFCGKFEVNLDVPSWVDDDGIDTIAQEIRVVSQSFGRDALEKHG